jgi:hypothetical protein
MRKEREGHVFPPYRLKVSREVGSKYLRSMGLPEDVSGEVPPTYMIFLRGETLGVNLFEALDIPRKQALHGGQRYEYFAPIAWGDEIEVTATVGKITEKVGKNGTLWFADVDFDYRKAGTGERVLREVTRLIKRG